MNEEPFRFVANVYVVFKDKDRYLLQLRSIATKFEVNQYSVVAGHVDGNETMLEAAKRETKEEIGIDLDIKHLKVAHVVHRKQSDQERVDFFVVPDSWQGTPVINEPDKAEDLR